MATNILIVDDDPSIRAYYKDLLEANGYTVFTACDAMDGNRAFREVNPNVVLLDIDMPGKSGLDLLREIKDMRDDLPVFLLTAHEDYKRNFASLYAEEYITKNKKPDLLLRKLQEYLHQS